MSVTKRTCGLVVVIVTALIVPLLGSWLAATLLHLAGYKIQKGSVLLYLYVQHSFMLILALLVILILKRLVPTDYGLHPPQRLTYIVPALCWGAIMGLLMLLIDYAPQLVTHTKPVLDYPLTPGSVSGWLFFEGVYVGPTEEIPLRSMLVPPLMVLWPARLRLRGFEMHWAGIVVALFFALLHATNFATQPWPIALGQQVYAFALGVFYAYWLEKSGSVLAPVVGHNASDVMEQLLLFTWIDLA